MPSEGTVAPTTMIVLTCDRTLTGVSCMFTLQSPSLDVCSVVFACTRAHVCACLATTIVVGLISVLCFILIAALKRSPRCHRTRNPEVHATSHHCCQCRLAHAKVIIVFRFEQKSSFFGGQCLIRGLHDAADLGGASHSCRTRDRILATIVAELSFKGCCATCHTRCPSAQCPALNTSTARRRCAQTRLTCCTTQKYTVAVMRVQK